MKSAISVVAVLACLALAANAAVSSSICMRIRCTPCHKCDEDLGKCVVDAGQAGCDQSLSPSNVNSACSTVRCAECHSCLLNDAGQARCVYQSDCCPAGQSKVFCSVSPCQTQAAQCPNNANCVVANCGSCQAKFYDKDLSEICVNGTSDPAVIVAPSNVCASATCPVNSSCIPEAKQCIQAPCPQFRCVSLNPCDSNPCQTDEQCVFNPNIRCIRAPCPQYTCEKINASDPCSTATCPSGTQCVPATTFCKKAPCPQYSCNSVSPCDGVQCQPGQICQPDVKQCLMAPCPQYQCVADPCATVRCSGKCVVDNGQAKCVDGGDPNDPCNGVQCQPGQICQPDVKQCFTTPCPQYQCVVDPCATVRCSGKCVVDNGKAKCLDGGPVSPCDGVQCQPGQICQPAVKQCLTTPCPQYQCIADPCATVRCSGKCVVDNGQAKCVDGGDPNDPCNGVQCQPGQICQPDVKQCFTTPCPQYLCVADPCATVRCPSKCVAQNGKAKCVDGGDQKINLVRCSQLPDAGKCMAVMRRWHFSRQSNRCEQFQYGGCGGNDNNFLTKSDCKMTCKNLPQCPVAKVLIADGCRMEGEVLNNSTLCPVPNIVCDNDPNNNCALINCMVGYTCQVTNGRAACVLIMDEKTKQCSQMPDAGNCEALMPRFYYSRSTNQCLNFTFGGCGGNSNNFNTIGECSQRCNGTPPCPMYSMIAPPPGCKYSGTEMNDQLCPIPKLVCNKTDVCATANCNAGQICVPSPKACLTTPCPQYNCVENPCNLVDCVGTCTVVNGQAQCVDNNNCALIDCMVGYTCQVSNGKAACVLIVDEKTKQCSQMPDAGNCDAIMPRFYYSRSASRCLNFTFGGCGGNSNNFNTIGECSQRCNGTPPCPMYSMIAPPPGCEYSGTEMNDQLCPKPKLVCNKTDVCATAKCSPGHTCVPSSKACFTTPCPQYDCVENPCNLVDCVGTCTVVNGQAQCVDNNNCALINCMVGYTCQVTNGKAACALIVDEKTKQCSQMPDAGNCEALMPRFYYSRSTNQCLNFTFGGCGGNSNNFNTIGECSQRCNGTPPCPMFRMMAPPPGCEYSSSEMNDQLCPIPKLVCNKTDVCATANCTAGQICVPSPKACLTTPCPQYNCVENPCNLVDCVGKCTVVNGQAQCSGNTDGEDYQLKMCSQLPDGGSCKSATSRWYYSRQLNRCDQFVYGGCDGNTNRFDTQEECNKSCANIPPCPMAMPPIAPPAGCEYVGNELNSVLCPVPKLVCAVEQTDECVALLCANDSTCQVVNGQAMCVDKTASDNRTITCSGLVEDNANGPMTAICAGQKQSWRYNRFSSSCEQVTWSGCGKNDNIFATQDECNQRCSGVQPCPQIKPARPLPGCEYQSSQLNAFLCPEPKLVCRWPTNCAGIMCAADSTCQVINGRAQCVYIEASDTNTIACSGMIEENVCGSVPKWRYNRQSSICENITWTGCSANQNLFNSKQECDQMCSNVEACPMVKPTPPGPGCEYNGTELDESLCPMPKLVCTENPDCTSVLCSPGAVCQMVNGAARCVQPSDSQLQMCSQLPAYGSCKAQIARWYYNRQTSNCQRFSYGGCEGNANNFASRGECERRCSGVSPCPVVDMMAPVTGCQYIGQQLDDQLLCPLPKLVCDEKAACAAINCPSGQKCAILTNGPKCVPSAPANCAVSGLVESSCPAGSPRPYYFNPISGKCEQSVGNGCQGDNLFSTVKQCERQCIEQRPCILPPIAAPPLGCNYDISNDSEGCPTVFNLQCPNGGPRLF